MSVVFPAPKNPEKMKETFVNQLKKTGESDFYVEDSVGTIIDIPPFISLNFTVPEKVGAVFTLRTGISEPIL